MLSERRDSCHHTAQSYRLRSASGCEFVAERAAWQFPIDVGAGSVRIFFSQTQTDGNVDAAQKSGTFGCGIHRWYRTLSYDVSSAVALPVSQKALNQERQTLLNELGNHRYP